MECFNRLTNQPISRPRRVYIYLLGAQSFLRSSQILSYFRKSLIYRIRMFSTDSKGAATCTYPEQVRTIPCPHIPLLKDECLCYTSIEAMAFQVASFPQIYHWLHLCTSLTPHVLQVPPISLNLIWSLVLYFVRSGRTTVWTTSMRLQLHLLLTTLKYHLCEINVYYMLRMYIIYCNMKNIRN
jgi:hypothetical protein